MGCIELEHSHEVVDHTLVRRLFKGVSRHRFTDLGVRFLSTLAMLVEVVEFPVYQQVLQDVITPRPTIRT